MNSEDACARGARRRARGDLGVARKSERVDPSFPVVGIGASAGGLDAFTRLLKELPADTGMAFVLIQHLDPKRASILTEILSRATAMPVSEVKDGMAVEPNHVYVIPPNASMAVLHGVLNLMPRIETRGQHMPIDCFLQSLAEDQGNRAIGVILSGTASDGVFGMQALKSAGGVTFAQDPASAEYDGMPRSAIAAGVADFILSPRDIARELARVARHPYVLRKPVPDTKGIAGEGHEDLMSKIFILVRRAKGVDFTYYKPTTISRRVARRMVVHKIERLQDYVRYLQENPAEVEELFQDILIAVTQFFREPEMFDVLKRDVMPAIVKERRDGDAIRVWVPGCSTGEEAYSLAIAWLEFLADVPHPPPLQFFATDVNEKALEQARAGVYQETLLADVSPERLRRFFQPVEGGYQIGKLIREMCIFARHDVTRDPPFSRLDLVSCRNLLIYLGPVLQSSVIPLLNYALQPSGYLILGSSETVGEYEDMFKVVSRKHRIYVKRSTGARSELGLMPRERPGRQMDILGGGPPIFEQKAKGFDAQAWADNILLAEYAPPGVLVNDELQILQFRGHTGKYLESKPGKPSLGILDMAREGLSVDLRKGLADAKKKKSAVVRGGVKYQHNGEDSTIDLDVIPVSAPAGESYYLVLFREDVAAGAAQEAAQESDPPAKRRAKTKAADDEASRLRKELEATREYLKTTLEEKDTTVEELRAAGEEVQSANEELQSINEELETAKEELQSTNEELTTVNEELQNRNLELAQLNDDLTNLLATVDIPIIMLGGDLRIRRFTPGAQRVANVIASDVGRPITDIKLRIDVPDLSELVAEVIDTVSMIEREIIDEEGRWYSLRIRPYKTRDNKIDGAVVTLLDIDDLKRSLQRVTEAGAFSDALNRVSAAIASTRDFDRMMQQVASEATAAMGVESAAISLRESAGWRTVWANGLPDEDAGRWISDKESPLSTAAAETGRPLAIDDVSTEARADERMLRAGVRSCLLAPLIAKKSVIGMMSFNHHSAAVAFGEGKIDFAAKLAALVALAIENARLQEARENAAQRFERVVETTTEGLLFFDQDGRVTMTNAAAARILGADRDTLLGRAYDELGWEAVEPAGKPVPKARLPFASVMKTGSSVTGEEFWLSAQDGSRVLVSVNASPIRDPDGNRMGVLASLADITGRSRAEEAIRESRERLGKALDNMPVWMVAFDEKSIPVMWNKEAERLSGYSAKEMIGNPQALERIYPDKRYREEMLREQKRRGSNFRDWEWKIATKRGGMRTVSYSNVSGVYPLPGWSDWGIGVDVTERRRAEDLTKALAAITVRLHSTLDLPAVVDDILRYAGQAFGAASVSLLLRDRDGWVADSVWGLPATTVGSRLTVGQSQHLSRLVEGRTHVEIYDTYQDERVNRDAMRRLGFRSILAAPLVIRSEVVGALEFHRGAPVGEFDDAEVSFATLLAVSLSLARENMRLYQGERQIAHTLQDSLVRPIPPIEGLDVGTAYASATESAEVGGDFFDLFRTDADLVVALIGDVSGKGIEAAGLTETVRGSARTLMYMDPSPAAALQRLNASLMRQLDPGDFVTAMIIVLDVKARQARVATAGHPPVAICGGDCRFPEMPQGQLLGVGDATYEDTVLELGRRRHTMLMYTDGLTEARRKDGQLFGEKRLLQALYRARAKRAQAIVDHLVQSATEFADGSLSDDIAVVALKL